MDDVVVVAAGTGPLAVPGLRVAVSCPAAAELLVVAASGLADAVLVSGALGGLDREVLARVRAGGLAVVGIAEDERQERRLRQLGVLHVRPVAAADLPDVVRAAVKEQREDTPVRGFAHARAVAPDPTSLRPDPAGAGSGRVLAVWGPAGAPGRTTLAVGLAAEIARLGWPVLLVDADPYGGAVATHLGLTDEVSGLAAACRAANLGVLDVGSLADTVLQRGPTLGLLSGVVAERWPELRPTALEVVLGLARSIAAVTVVDVGFCLEQDEELSYDTLAPRRNGATLTALDVADVVVAVGTGDPVGLPRLLRGLGELGSALPGVEPLVVLNRVRALAAPAREALQRLAGVQHLTAVPEDVAACDAALRAGLTLVEAAPASPARQAVQALAQSLLR